MAQAATNCDALRVGVLAAVIGLADCCLAQQVLTGYAGPGYVRQHVLLPGERTDLEAARRIAAAVHASEPTARFVLLRFCLRPEDCERVLPLSHESYEDVLRIHAWRAPTTPPLVEYMAWTGGSVWRVRDVFGNVTISRTGSGPCGDLPESKCELAWVEYTDPYRGPLVRGTALEHLSVFVVCKGAITTVVGDKVADQVKQLIPADTMTVSLRRWPWFPFEPFPLVYPFGTDPFHPPTLAASLNTPYAQCVRRAVGEELSCTGW